MKKIFACDQFAADENKGFSFTSITSKKYLETMLSCIENGELCIAQKEDDVSVELAADLTDASYVKRYVIDVAKMDIAGIIEKEQSLSNICKEISGKIKRRSIVREILKAEVKKVAAEKQMCIKNIFNRALRLEKLYELGAPDFVIHNERRYLIESIALNAFATECEVIGIEDFSKSSAFEGGGMCVKFNDLPKDIQNQIAKIHEEIRINKELWERRNAALRELEQNYKTDEPVFGAMYMTPSGTLIDCSLFPNGHADVSAWLHEQGLEIDYRPGEPSQLLHLKGWLRLNTKVGYIEEPHGVLTARQRDRLESIFNEGKFLWTEIQR